jgi:hypothetical protein
LDGLANENVSSERVFRVVCAARSLSPFSLVWGLAATATALSGRLLVSVSPACACLFLSLLPPYAEETLLLHLTVGGINLA